MLLPFHFYNVDRDCLVKTQFNKSPTQENPIFTFIKTTDTRRLKINSTVLYIGTFESDTETNQITYITAALGANTNFIAKKHYHIFLTEHGIIGAIWENDFSLIPNASLLNTSSSLNSASE